MGPPATARQSVAVSVSGLEAALGCLGRGGPSPTYPQLGSMVCDGEGDALGVHILIVVHGIEGPGPNAPAHGANAGTPSKRQPLTPPPSFPSNITATRAQIRTSIPNTRQVRWGATSHSPNSHKQNNLAPTTPSPQIRGREAAVASVLDRSLRAGSNPHSTWEILYVYRQECVYRTQTRPDQFMRQLTHPPVTRSTSTPYAHRVFHWTLRWTSVATLLSSVHS